MKVLLVSINSKFIHSNIAALGLLQYAKSKNQTPGLLEFTISDQSIRIAGEISAHEPLIVAFSSYVWNIEKILYVADILKKSSKNISIILGGPHINGDLNMFLNKQPFIDGLVRGEGEETFLDICINGMKSDFLFTRENKNPKISDKIALDSLPFSYTDNELKEKGRIFYYESSRGCPFSCSYCLSPAWGNPRYKSLQKVFDELKFFIENKVSLVKFVDRTFNADSRRAELILDFILENNIETEFHFEICAEMLTNSFVTLAARFKDNLRFEIGLQSIHEKALNAVNRACNLEKFKANFTKLKDETNAVIHLDLIAGLPFESYEDFKNSFDFAYLLAPSELQLGFLKLLSGTKLENDLDKYGYEFSKEEPREVIKNTYISFLELCRLKNIERCLDIYFNSKMFTNTLQSLPDVNKNPFNFYEAFSDYIFLEGALKAGLSTEKRFNLFYNYLEKENGLSGNVIKAMVTDFIFTGQRVPPWLLKSSRMKKKFNIYELLVRDNNHKKLELSQDDVLNWHKMVKTINVFDEIWLYENSNKKILNVTEYF